MLGLSRVFILLLCVFLSILFFSGCSSLPIQEKLQQASIPNTLPAPIPSALPNTTSLPQQQITKIAHQLMGSPYHYGGVTPDGFDCSGFIQYIFKQANIQIPRTAALQRDASQTIPSLQKLRQGDLIFFKTSIKNDHVGVYIGNAQFIHASTGQKKVRKSNLHNNYWRKHFVKFGRLIPDGVVSQ
ncbi:MAG: C40 family peptidase [Thiotrichaceae bacterium]|nr:C40 family peptidase [Thiotrichaceae bacterium]